MCTVDKPGFMHAEKTLRAELLFKLTDVTCYQTFLPVLQVNNGITPVGFYSNYFLGVDKLYARRSADPQSIRRLPRGSISFLSPLHGTRYSNTKFFVRNRFQQVIDGIYTKCLHCVVGMTGNKHHRTVIAAYDIHKVKTIPARHVYVEKNNVGYVLHYFTHGIVHRSRRTCHFYIGTIESEQL